MPATLPILMFHAIDDAASPTCFPLPGFRRAMAQLHGNGWQTVQLAQAARQLRAGQSLPARSVVLTFDDGDGSVFERAWPVLQQYRMTATVFVLPHTADGTAGARPRTFLGRRLMTGAEARQMHRAGIDFGAHTLDHADLTRLPEREAERQIRESRLAVQDMLGAEVTSFAYPYGRHDRGCREIVQQHFACACTDELGLASPGDDVYRLRRVDAYYLRAARRFDLIFTTRLSWYLRLRNLPRRVRRVVRTVVAR